MLVDCSPVAKLHPFRPLITLKPRSVLLIKAHKVAAALEHKSLQKKLRDYSQFYFFLQMLSAVGMFLKMCWPRVTYEAY